MALTTRCPHCGTAFKVVPDQLRLRHGLVRCGVCATIFDGQACLLSDTAGPLNTSAVAQVAGPAVLRKRSDIMAADPIKKTDEDADQENEHWSMPADAPAPYRTKPEPAFSSRGRHASTSSFDPASTPLLESEGQAANYDDSPVLGESRLRFSSAVDVGRPPPDFLNEDRYRHERWVRLAWSWLCIGGLLAFCLQLLFVYRSPIATAIPALRPVLERACVQLNCRVGYARRIERITIVSSSLQPLPGAAGLENSGHTRLMLTVSLRNRYNRDQTWPALMLELTDSSDTVVARKVLLPADYLSSAQASRPLAAGAEVTVSTSVEVAGFQVNGYQLDKFFP